ncbi:MAG: DUF1761 domain-containing protein [Candidatus Promineifilaceae bacterium]
MEFGPINWLAVLVATVVNMALGAGWYTTLGDAWLRAQGKTRADIEGAGSGGMEYVGAAVGHLIANTALAIIIGWLAAPSLANGLLVGLLAGVGFVATTMSTNHLFEGRSRQLYWINLGHHLLNLLVSGAILGAWR